MDVQGYSVLYRFIVPLLFVHRLKSTNDTTATKAEQTNPLQLVYLMHQVRVCVGYFGFYIPWLLTCLLYVASFLGFVVKSYTNTKYGQGCRQNDHGARRCRKDLLTGAVSLSLKQLVVLLLPVYPASPIKIRSVWPTQRQHHNFLNHRVPTTVPYRVSGYSIPFYSIPF